MQIVMYKHIKMQIKSPEAKLRLYTQFYKKEESKYAKLLKRTLERVG